MTAGRGFIALAAVIFGRWTPHRRVRRRRCCSWSPRRSASRSGRTRRPGTSASSCPGIQASYPSIYNNFFAALPYILTIIVLAGVVGRSIPPAAVGQPYDKEGAT